MSATAAAAGPARRWFTEERIAALLVLALCAALIFAIALPLLAVLSRSVLDTQGRFVGLANYIRYVTTPALVQSLLNSLSVAALTTAIVIPLAFLYAYALTRSRIPAKGLFYALALLPVFAPSLLPALSFIALFGSQGILEGLLLGASIYGPIGIVLAQVVHCLPHATMILVAALGLADGRLYEAAASLGTSPWRVFTTVTLPAARYGLVSAAVVVFTLVITDFGIAKVIGGPFEVLATEAYRQMVGQQNFGMGAVVGMVLLVPAVLAFFIDRRLRRRQLAPLSARAVPHVPQANRRRDTLLLGYCLAIGGLVAAVLGAAAWVSLIRDWPRDPSLTLANFDFAAFDPDGWQPYVNSLRMAALTALIGTPVVFLGAYVMEKTGGAPRGRAVARFLALLPMAVPGVVLGLGYVFFFTAPGNPAGALHGTIAILALSCIAHFYTVTHVTAVTSLRQIDGEFEAVSASLQVPFWVTLRRVTLPICLPAILDIAVYLFVSAMTTVAAVIFLYGPGTKLAAIAIVQMDEAGSIAAATAMATCIVVTCLGIKLLHLLLDALLFRRFQRWRAR